MALVLALLALLGVVRGQVGPLVQTEYGPVRGATIAVNVQDSTIPINNFYGIPYASPPVDELRFAPPQKAIPWDGEFDAIDLPWMCMQNPIGLMFMTHPLWIRYREDCLTLNIHAPQNASPGSLAVLVWFHGGGYTGGGSIQTPGHFMATKDVVVVTVNYRLGVFGFASTPDNAVRGNMGMLDQVMALQFVRDNIAAFGGNPARVTIFGQSAGASSAALHMVSPVSRGLFYQAIMESGAENNIWSVNYPDQSPENYIYQVADNAGCTTASIPEMLTCLRSINARDLRIADSITCTPGYFCQGFAPIVDGPGGFLPDVPLTLREQLGSNSVPVIGGHCSDDGSLYTLYFIPEADDGGFTRDEFNYYLRTRLVNIFEGPLDETEIENAYQAMNWYYSPWPYLEDEEANRQAFNKMITDAAFGYPWDRNAKINSQFAPTYTYIQSFKSLNSTSFIPEWMGVPHNGELAYVWGYSYLLINPDVRDNSGIHFDILGWTPEDMPYSNFVQTLWTNFAKFGNPTPTPVQSPYNNTMITWPRFDISDNLKVLNLDGEIRIDENYRQQDYAFYIDYLSYIGGRPVANKAKASGRKSPPLTSAQFQQQTTKMVIDMIRNRFGSEYDEELQRIQNEY
jgi:carboxylesterase type B